MNTEQLENNVIESFRLDKSDVVRMQNIIATLSENQERLLHQLADTREKEISLYHRLKELNGKTVPKVVVNKIIKVKSTNGRKKVYFASKKSDKFHAENCVFAKNIKPKSRLVFKSKNKALNIGLKACDCIKKI